MASFKTTATWLLVLLILAGAAGGGTYLYFVLQQRAILKDLTVAESLLTQNKAKDADELLAKRLEDASPRVGWYPKALALRFRSLEQLGDKAGMQALATQVLDPQKPLVKPGVEAWSRADLILGQAAIDAKKSADARKYFDALLAQPPTTYGYTLASLGLARLDMADGKVPAARDKLDALLSNLADNDPARQGVEKALGLCNMTMLMSREQYPGDNIYVIAKGDTPDGLRKRFKVDPGVLMKINQIADARKLTIGRRIKIPDVDWSIVVNKSDNTLTLNNHGKFFKKYQVRTGEIDWMTPTGDFTIENKKIDPDWNNPKDNKTYKSGDPGNQLGCRWMAFRGSLGIHEAVDQATLGRYSSSGCVGMAHDDVIELFDLVPLHTPVKITGQIIKASS